MSHPYILHYSPKTKTFSVVKKCSEYTSILVKNIKKTLEEVAVAGFHHLICWFSPQFFQLIVEKTHCMHFKKMNTEFCGAGVKKVKNVVKIKFLRLSVFV